MSYNFTVATVPPVCCSSPVPPSGIESPASVVARANVLSLREKAMMAISAWIAFAFSWPIS